MGVSKGTEILAHGHCVSVCRAISDLQSQFEAWRGQSWGHLVKPICPASRIFSVVGTLHSNMYSLLQLVLQYRFFCVLFVVAGSKSPQQACKLCVSSSDM